MGRRGDSIWDHWSVFESPNPKKMSMDKMKCKYCEVIHCRNTLRSKRHTIKCPGDIPDHVRKQYEAEVEEILQEESKGEKRPYKRSATRITGDDGDEFDLPTGSRYSSGLEKKRAVELISDLLQLNESTITPRKKPLSQFTEEDFKKEERELAIRKTRAEIKNIELSNELYERLIHAADRFEPFLSKGNQLMDLMIGEKAGRHLAPSVEVVYTQQHEHAEPSENHIQGTTEEITPEAF